jgi:hypothetical protein
MTELSTHTQAELAHRSSGGMDVTLFWAPARGEDREDKVVVCVRDRRDGAYFEILAEPYLALDVSTTRSPTGTGARACTTTVAWAA